ncbi:hypothetical protein ACFL3D_00505 [Candidatus Omnitrophota bacterium]
MNKKQYKKYLEMIVGEEECCNENTCYGLGYKALSQATKIDNKWHLNCLKKDFPQCAFLMEINQHSLCKCPYRNFIIEQLESAPQCEFIYC